MVHKKAVILRAADSGRAERELEQRLNPKAKFYATGLARLAGLERTGVSRGRIPPGGEAFAYHAHLREEEWVFVLSGRARARIDGEAHELGAGDFAAFPAPQAPHVLTNPYAEDCVYLMGGERTQSPDVLEYPELAKRYLLVREGGLRVSFHELGPAEFPFGAAGAERTATRWRVLASKGCGSTIAELALALAEVPYDRVEVDYATEAGRAVLLPHNPLAQVPTVILPDGGVATETLAIVQLLDEERPGSGLLPRVGDPLRREALRWATFLVAAIYPTFTYGDDVARWGGDERLRASTDAHREAMWRYLEGVAGQPWFLGPRFSAIDLYIAVMAHWRPRRAWFAEHAPRLHAIADAVVRDPRLAPIMAANFG
jgi:GST-like protein